jgi:hypothetical protein
MTKEEAIEFIAQSVKSDVDMAKVADAIKALEQKPALEKTIAEITELRDSYEKDNYHDEADALTIALEIFDKYKAESEDI